MKRNPLKKALLTLLAFACFMGVAYVNEPTQAEDLISVNITGTYNYDWANQILDLMNQERAKVGASPLKMDLDLLEAAMYRAKECSVYYAHERPDGSDPCTVNWDKMYAENIAQGFNSPQEAMTGWMNSAGHRFNILDDYDTAGVGVFYNGHRYFFVQVFGYDEGDYKYGVKTGTGAVSETITTKPEHLDFYIYDEGFDKVDGEYPVGSLGFFHYNIIGRSDIGVELPTALNDGEYQIVNANPDVVNLDVANGIFTTLKGGTARITISLTKYPSVSRTLEIKVAGGGSEEPTTNDISKATINNFVANFAYDKKAHEQNVTVSYNGSNLVNGTDYTVSYQNNVEPGTATMTITGKGNYTGTLTKTYSISLTLGDANKDLTVDYNDAVTILKMAAGEISYNDAVKTAADVTKDGKISYEDAIKVLQYDSKMINSFN